MLNQAVLVGRLKYVSLNFIEIAVYNKEDIKEYDLVPVVLSEGIAENVNKYSKADDLIGVKGRLAVKDGRLSVIAEKITFLSSSKGGD